MALREIGAKLTLEGQQEWNKQMSAAKREMQNLKSALVATSAEFAGQANSMEALRKKQEILAKMQAQQTEIVRALAEAVEDGKKMYGESSTEVDKLTREYNAAQAQLYKLNADVKQNAEYLAEAEESADHCATSIDEYGKKTKEADDKSNGLLQSIIRLVPGLGSLNISSLTTVGVIGAIAGALGSAWKYMMQLEESTRELRTSLAKFQSSAITAGLAIDGQLNEALTSAYVATEDFDSAFEALSNLIMADYSGSGMLDVLDELKGAVVAFPDTLKLESLSDSLQETIASGSSVGQFDELLTRLGVNTDDFNASMAELNSTAERQDLIFRTLHENGLSEIWQDYADANSEAIALTEAEARLQLSQARLAQSSVGLKAWWTDVKTYFVNMGTVWTQIGDWGSIFKFEDETGIHGLTALDQLQAYGLSFSDLQEKADEANISIGEAYYQFLDTAQAAEEAADAQDGLNSAVDLSAEEISVLVDKTEDLRSAYESIESAVANTVSGFTDLSEQLENQATTGEALKAGLESQITTMQEYSDNLATLQELGASESLMTYFSENFDAEHAAELQALVETDRSTIDEIFALWDEKDVTAAGLMESMAEANPMIQDLLEEIGMTLGDAVDNWDMYYEAQDAGWNTAQGYINGMKSQINAAYAAGQAIANAEHAGYTAADNQHSPSKRSEQEAKNTVLGWTNTLRASLREFASAGADMADAVHTGYASVIGSGSGAMMISGGGQTIHNNTTNYSLPAINVYGAQGQSETEIAKRVKTELYREFQRASEVYKS